jgi:hypothetical protein
MNSMVGHCPRCGAPIYVPTVWHGITPPPNTYSCYCFQQNQPVWRSSTTYRSTNPDLEHGPDWQQYLDNQPKLY